MLNNCQKIIMNVEIALQNPAKRELITKLLGYGDAANMDRIVKDAWHEVFEIQRGACDKYANEGE